MNNQNPGFIIPSGQNEQGYPQQQPQNLYPSVPNPNHGIP